MKLNSTHINDGNVTLPNCSRSLVLGVPFRVCPSAVIDPLGSIVGLRHGTLRLSIVII